MVPQKHTTYLCTGFQLPDLGGKHHMIEVSIHSVLQYMVPQKHTTYLCTGFQLPDLGGKHHMIKVSEKYSLLTVSEV